MTTPGLCRASITGLLQELKDAVKGLLPGPGPATTRYFEADHLTVDVASAEYLPAMKLFAPRVETDIEDIAFLYGALGYTTLDEGLDPVQSVYRGRPIDAKVQFLLEEVVDSLHRPGSPALLLQHQRLEDR